MDQIVKERPEPKIVVEVAGENPVAIAKKDEIQEAFDKAKQAYDREKQVRKWTNLGVFLGGPVVAGLTYWAAGLAEKAGFGGAYLASGILSGVILLGIVPALIHRKYRTKDAYDKARDRLQKASQQADSPKV